MYIFHICAISLRIINHRRSTGEQPTHQPQQQQQRHQREEIDATGEAYASTSNEHLARLRCDELRALCRHYSIPGTAGKTKPSLIDMYVIYFLWHSCDLNDVLFSVSQRIKAHRIGGAHRA